MVRSTVRRQIRQRIGSPHQFGTENAGCNPNDFSALPEGVGFQNKATVLYNAMIAPLKNLTFKGVLWYQGESNTGRKLICYIRRG
jgi:hypothetical protein